MGEARAGTLPDSCVDPTDLDSLSAFRAQLVAPPVVDTASLLYSSLHSSYGTDDCPAADGATCTGPTGVHFSGTLESSSSSDRAECNPYYGLEIYSTSGETRAALSIVGIPGGNLEAFGESGWFSQVDRCSEYDTTSGRWEGTLGVTGEIGSMADQRLIATAGIAMIATTPTRPYTW